MFEVVLDTRYKIVTLKLRSYQSSMAVAMWQKGDRSMAVKCRNNSWLDYRFFGTSDGIVTHLDQNTG